MKAINFKPAYRLYNNYMSIPTNNMNSVTQHLDSKGGWLGKSMYACDLKEQT